MSTRKPNPHARAFGRMGGKSRSAAKSAAARKNGARGGRPVELQRVGNIEVHAEAELVCVTATGPAFRAGSLAARQWLRRHGYRYGEVQAGEWRGRAWAKPRTEASHD